MAPSEDAPAGAAVLRRPPAALPCAEASRRAVHEASHGPWGRQKILGKCMVYSDL